MAVEVPRMSAMLLSHVVNYRSPMSVSAIVISCDEVTC